MNQQHIIQTTLAQFPKTLADLIARRDVALEVRNLASDGKNIACIVEESQRGTSSPGALIEMAASATKDPQAYADELRAKNPLWKIAAVFPLAESARGKASTIVVATLHQP